MITFNKKILAFNIKEVHLSEKPRDFSGCSFLKFFDCKKKVIVKGFNCKKELTTVIDLTQDLDTIFQNMNKNTRNCIKRAQKMGIIVEKNKNYEHFFKIYKSFKQKKGLKSLFEVFGIGKITIKDMKKYGTLFTAAYDNKILGGGLYLENKSIIKGLIGASKRIDVDKNIRKIVGYGNRLLEWEAIKYAKNKSIKEFDLGGLWPEIEAKKDQKKKGINTFKLGFGGEIVCRYSYYKIYSKIYSVLYNLYALKKF